MRTQRDSPHFSKINIEIETQNEVGFFQDIAVLIKDRQKEPIFYKGRILRMRKKGTRAKIEYIRPIPLNNNDEYGYVELLLGMYVENSEGKFKYTEDKKEFLMWNVAMGVRMTFDEDTSFYELDADDRKEITDMIAQEVFKKTKSKAVQNTSSSSGCNLQTIADDGRRVNTIEPVASTSGLRQSTRKRKIITHDY